LFSVAKERCILVAPKCFLQICSLHNIHTCMYIYFVSSQDGIRNKNYHLFLFI
jgi:hypothetical protein